MSGENKKANRANDWLLVGSEPACTAYLSRNIIGEICEKHHGIGGGDETL